jgi:hypothetical protein
VQICKRSTGELFDVYLGTQSPHINIKNNGDRLSKFLGTKNKVSNISVYAAEKVVLVHNNIIYA